MKTKLTTVEKRAEAFCRGIKGRDETFFTVEWKKSAMWGHNPCILYRGEKATNVSGCGYDKLSQCLADCLRFLGGNNEEMHAIWQTGGAGDSATIAALERLGWLLERIATTRTSDTYRIAKK